MSYTKSYNIVGRATDNLHKHFYLTFGNAFCLEIIYAPRIFWYDLTAPTCNLSI